jgi:hypothetical protein
MFCAHLQNEHVALGCNVNGRCVWPVITSPITAVHFPLNWNLYCYTALLLLLLLQPGFDSPTPTPGDLELAYADALRGEKVR